MLKFCHERRLHVELLSGSREQDIESARGCISHLERLFRELSDYRAFELLRTHAHRSDYLLLKQVRYQAFIIHVNRV